MYEGESEAERHGREWTGWPVDLRYVNPHGARAEDPALDPDFNVADLLILLPLSNINARYAQHFLANAA